MKRFLFTFVLMIAVMTVQGSDYDTDRGFRHPGGLHSESDFQRVRQQLADGNATVKAAYQVLCNSAYAKSTTGTTPVETIVRGGGSGENYMHAARGAATAYQNALRWRISGQVAYAKHAVEVLMQWARTTKAIGGDSNYALASGIYGYEFAQAAELVRDYEGWAREDFEEFKQWMLTVWYPYAIGFLRGRNGTWENTGKWWQAPGHYWSNWGLCNALCLISIGVLCDDVFIYNQGMSYYKYDQCGTYKDPRTEVPIKNDGLTEFLGNLVVTTTESDLETGAYGKIGQMQESGRDIGHTTMAAGLAVDIAKVGWNQGDDLFAYMDHRLAAGLEYVAAQTQSISDLPWTNYHVASSGYYYSDSRAALHTAPALGEQIRPYWGAVIGFYEGVKGVSMPFSEWSYGRMGIDGGGQGSVSGGYDHLGFSVLMNTREQQLASPEDVPTELTPMMTYSGSFNTNLIPGLAVERTLGNVSGKTIYHNEMGGLVNTYTTNNKTGVPKGQTLVLSPQLPEGVTDTGKWLWESGETTREITITTDRSRIYRVQYTNENGVTSEQSFSIAVQGDCTPTAVTPSYTVSGVTVNDTIVDILYGTTVTFGISGKGGFNTWTWEGGKTTETVTLSRITSSRTLTGAYVNQGGAQSEVTFHINVSRLRPVIAVNGEQTLDSVVIVSEGDDVVLGTEIASSFKNGTFLWDDESTADTLALDSIISSQEHTLVYTKGEQSYTLHFMVYVRPAKERLLEVGNYVIEEAVTGRLLTSEGKGSTPSFQPRDEANSLNQQWYLYRTSTTQPYYDLVALNDSSKLNAKGVLVTSTYRPYRIVFAAGTDLAAIYTNQSGVNPYLTVAEDGAIDFAGSAKLYGFPFQITPVTTDAINEIMVTPSGSEAFYDLSGRRVLHPHGIYIEGGKKRIKK